MSSSFRRTRARKSVTTDLSLKAKNSKLVKALNEARTEISRKRDEILCLKRERQAAMERVISLETRIGDVVPLRDTHKTLYETLSSIEDMITKAKNLIGTTFGHVGITDGNHALPPPICSPIQKSLPMHLQQASSTPNHSSGDKALDMDIETTTLSQLYSTKIDLEELNTTSKCITESLESRATSYYEPRPKRTCTSLVQSYLEPGIGCKRRQGDPHTTSFNYSPPPKHEGKRRTLHKKHSSRRGLSNITNIAT